MLALACSQEIGCLQQCITSPKALNIHIGCPGFVILSSELISQGTMLLNLHSMNKMDLSHLYFIWPLAFPWWPVALFSSALLH